MKCEEIQEAISALVDAELGPDEEREVRRHLDECARCRERFDALDRAAGLVGALEGPQPAPDFLARLDRRLGLELEIDGFVARPSRRVRAVWRPRWGLR